MANETASGNPLPEVAIAKSDFNSKTMIANRLVIVLSLLVNYVKPEWFPTEYAPYIVALLGLANMALRKFTYRPTALIAPGKTTVVTVPRL